MYHPPVRRDYHHIRSPVSLSHTFRLLPVAFTGRLSVCSSRSRLRRSFSSFNFFSCSMTRAFSSSALRCMACCRRVSISLNLVTFLSDSSCCYRIAVVNNSDHHSGSLTFLAATAAFCKTFLTSGLALLPEPIMLLINLVAWPKKPTFDCCEEGVELDIWL